MTNKMVDHGWIFLTVGLAAYSQLIMKWQMSTVGPLPVAIVEKVQILFKAALNPWVLSALVATFLSGVSWMVTLTKFELSYAFPFTALNFLVMYLIGVLVFGEHSSAPRLIGTIAILVGVLMIVTSNAEAN